MDAGATINETIRFANITLAESDNPQGVVYFAVGHRLPTATVTTTRLSLQVFRRASTSSVMSVQYRTVVSSKQKIAGQVLQVLEGYKQNIPILLLVSIKEYDMITDYQWPWFINAEDIFSSSHLFILNSTSLSLWH